MGTFRTRSLWPRRRGRCCARTRSWRVLPVLSFAAWLVIAATFALPIVAVEQRCDRERQLDLEPRHVDPRPRRLRRGHLRRDLLQRRARLRRRRAPAAAATRPRRARCTALASAPHVLLPWAIVSATVSLVLRAIEERAGIVGRIVVGLVGLAWSLVTFLVLPILVVERLGVGRGGEAVGRAVQAHVGRERDRRTSASVCSVCWPRSPAASSCLPLILVGGPVARPRDRARSSRGSSR